MKAVQVRTWVDSIDVSGISIYESSAIVSGGICFSIPYLVDADRFEFSYNDIPANEDGMVELVEIYFSNQKHILTVLRDDFDKLVAELD